MIGAVGPSCCRIIRVCDGRPPLHCGDPAASPRGPQRSEGPAQWVDAAEVASTNKKIKTIDYNARTTNRTTNTKVLNGAAWCHLSPSRRPERLPRLLACARSKTARSPDAGGFAGRLVEPVPGQAARWADSELDDNGRRRRTRQNRRAAASTFRQRRCCSLPPAGPPPPPCPGASMRGTLEVYAAAPHRFPDHCRRRADSVPSGKKLPATVRPDLIPVADESNQRRSGGVPHLKADVLLGEVEAAIRDAVVAFHPGVDFTDIWVQPRTS